MPYGASGNVFKGAECTADPPRIEFEVESSLFAQRRLRPPVNLCQRMKVWARRACSHVSEAVASVSPSPNFTTQC